MVTCVEKYTAPSSVRLSFELSLTQYQSPVSFVTIFDYQLKPQTLFYSLFINKYSQLVPILESEKIFILTLNEVFCFHEVIQKFLVWYQRKIYITMI